MTRDLPPRDSGPFLRRIVEKVEILWGDRGSGQDRALRVRESPGSRSQPSESIIGGGAAWGSISGNIADQADLQAALSSAGGGGGGGSVSAAETFETVAKNLSASDASLTYAAGNLVTVVYANGITKTLTYASGDLISVTLSGTTPGGIELTKTLIYSGGELNAIAYS